MEEMGCFLMLQKPVLVRYCIEVWVFSEMALILSNAITTWAWFCITEDITAAYTDSSYICNATFVIKMLQPRKNTNPSLVFQLIAILKLTSPIGNVPTRSALVLETKYSFVSLASNLNNKNSVCQQ